VTGIVAADATVRFDTDSEAYCLPVDVIAHIPVVRWKLHEVHLRRYVDN
jgi:hypothetical protein